MILSFYSKKLSHLLTEKKLTLSVAESCTGGLFSSLITMHQGASQFFESGMIVYSNQAKKDFLQVPEAILNKYGAVSKEVAVLLANNIKKNRKADVAVAITGIAGPKSDDTEKPVGLVYVAINNQYNKSVVKECRFNGSRKKNQKQACKVALTLLLENIKD